jgi:hypothetical protein
MANDGNGSPMLLKADNAVQRYPDRSARNPAVDPLTEKEKVHLREVCWEKCRNAYIVRMTSSALLSDYEVNDDLIGEAWIFMENILGKFDKSKCGEISDYDIEGKTASKTLKFYFQNYYYGRVNFVACEARDYKKKRGIGPRGTPIDVAYDEDFDGDFTEFNHEYEATSNIFLELNKKSTDFQRFFEQSYRIQLSQKELREEWGGRFNKLKQELTKFKTVLKQKYHIEYITEIGADRINTKKR